MNDLTNNTKVDSMTKITTPKQLIRGLELDDETAQNVELWRSTTQDIIHMKNDKLLVVVWPCSIHDTHQALEYAEQLKNLEKKYPNLFIVMRTYFEKPRTTIGWKWLINDPHLDGSFDIETGLRKARELLVEINKMWLPVSTEFLDPVSPQYISDLITWWAIGARTTESQIHRELASWLSAIIGFKNGTNWDTQIAIDAIGSASQPHRFLWTNENGETSIIETKWNPDCHIILRGGKWITNYDEVSVDTALKELKESWIDSGVMIDASHANSNKDFKNQPKVIHNVAEQLKAWNTWIIWVMIESNIWEWNQSFTPWKDDANTLQYWISITDACVSLEDTDTMLAELDQATKIRNNS